MISVNDATYCENHDLKSPDEATDFFKNSFRRSSNKTTHINRELERKIDEYIFLNNIDYSLFTFPTAELIHHKKILSEFKNEEIVSLVLRPLPVLPRVTQSQKQIILRPSTNVKNRDDIIPGDSFNLFELINSRSGFLPTKNFVTNIKDKFIPSFSSSSYLKCRKPIKNDVPKVENGKLEVFEEMFKLRNFGIDPINLNERRTCLKLTFCSRLRKQSLLVPSVTVIKLNKNSKNNVEYDISENKNIMLWNSASDETHFVRSAEKGDCVSQMLIYPYGVETYDNRSTFDGYPIFISKILSASRNHTLEKRIADFVSNDLRNVIGERKSYDFILKTFEELEHSSLSKIRRTKASFFEKQFNHSYNSNAAMNGIVRILIIALIAITNAQAMRNLRVGDTVDLSKQYSDQIIVSDIFNGFNGSRFIKEKYDDEYNNQMFYRTCMLFESLKTEYYPQVLIDKKLSDSASLKLFYYTDLWREKNLGVNENYINNDHFRYGFVKLCHTHNVQTLNIKLIDDEYFSKIVDDNTASIWMNETVVFRLKRDNETHYVSSISTGTCLIQISVNDATYCENHNPKSPNEAADFFKNSFHRSSIKSTHINRELERKIDEYIFLNNIDYSLFTFPSAEFIHQKKILSEFKNEEIVSLVLRPLPVLSFVRKSQEQIILRPSTDVKNRGDIAPGDIFNLDKSLKSRSGFLTTRNFETNTKDEFIPSSGSYSYSNCRKPIKNDVPKVENGKLEVFEEMFKRQNFGINPNNLNERETCLKLTVCSRLTKQSLLIPPMTIIKLNKNSKNNVNYNIFENKNIILWNSASDETHFVRSAEKGDCVSQMLIYPFDVETYERKSIFDDNSTFMGEILSASHNRTLEKRIANFVNNDLRNVIGSKSNSISILKTFEELEHNNLVSNTSINLYLEKIV
ncbi:hypothetical protein KQX54_004098 [Cotesia glomerata]|uniref:Uncharacterized protein n=1 Tax=Cotesia glomerata TaxID=32391 RepID=A0AAV7IKU3_COTGL|nr:hypothetical protein KQX54_004098 [Cotesia glomerata]